VKAGVVGLDSRQKFEQGACRHTRHTMYVQVEEFLLRYGVVQCLLLSDPVLIEQGSTHQGGPIDLSREVTTFAGVKLGQDSRTDDQPRFWIM
jgi:hypothetical protein